ncbi:hypothetical protein [Streptomyces nojiriensis]|nr:hypothetical protein [Streptomyces nojiriensis]
MILQSYRAGRRTAPICVSRVREQQGLYARGYVDDGEKREDAATEGIGL